MKIRTDYVTNSSSSNFILGLKKKPSNLKETREFLTSSVPPFIGNEHRLIFLYNINNGQEEFVELGDIQDFFAEIIWDRINTNSTTTLEEVTADLEYCKKCLAEYLPFYRTYPTAKQWWKEFIGKKGIAISIELGDSHGKYLLKGKDKYVIETWKEFLCCRNILIIINH